MKLVPFIADSPAAALAQIHDQLGPEAVVLSVQPVPASGLSRLWQTRRKVEVLAGVPDESPKSKVQSPKSEGSSPQPTVHGPQSPASRFALHVSRLTPDAMLHAPRSALADPSRPHVFIGPPGVGKTTLLCKWLARSVLTHGHKARLWRLDGANANTAEFLNVYAEMFGLPVERFWEAGGSASCSLSPLFSSSFSGSELNALAGERGRERGGGEQEDGAGYDLLLVDLPGVESGDAQGLAAVAQQLAALPKARLHLVLNAAYDLSLLFEQVRAFAPLQPEELSFTHLDEVPNQAKLGDLLSGTNCSLRFLSAGQKVPGEFFETGAAAFASPEISCENGRF